MAKGEGLDPAPGAPAPDFELVAVALPVDRVRRVGCFAAHATIGAGWPITLTHQPTGCVVGRFQTLDDAAGFARVLLDWFDPTNWTRPRPLAAFGEAAADVVRRASIAWGRE